MSANRLVVPAALAARIRESACDMGVPPGCVLEACVEMGLSFDRADDLVLETEAALRRLSRKVVIGGRR